ncbi:MAG: YncE family protein [Acidimicrobiales bacterium]
MTAARYGFDGPSALLLAGSDLFVANPLGPSITEVNAKTGAFVGLILGLHGVGAMASNGTGVFVAGSDEVTEIDASNGHVVRTLSGPSYGFADPSTINAEGANLWVWNLSVGTLTELPTAAS